MRLLYNARFWKFTNLTTRLTIDSNMIRVIPPQIWDQFQVYSMNSMGYHAGERETLSHNSDRARWPVLHIKMEKSSTPDRACLTGELCLIIGDSLSAVLCVCLCVYGFACALCVDICVIWHFPFEHTWQLQRHHVLSKHAVTIQGEASFINCPQSDNGENGGQCFTKRDNSLTFAACPLL